MMINVSNDRHSYIYINKTFRECKTSATLTGLSLRGLRIVSGIVFVFFFGCMLLPWPCVWSCLYRILRSWAMANVLRLALCLLCEVMLHGPWSRRRKFRKCVLKFFLKFWSKIALKVRVLLSWRCVWPCLCRVCCPWAIVVALCPVLSLSRTVM